MLGLSACASRQPDDEPHRIVASVMKQITGGGQPICIDARTRGEPLAIFRTMIVAPDPSRRALAWRTPGSLIAGRDIGSRALVENALHDNRTRLPLAESTAPPLPMIDQIRLNGLAREAMVTASVPQMPLDNVSDAPLARVRWWPFNRFDGGCREIYTISKPVVIHDTAFVSVTAGHQGTTYALDRRGPAWAPTAQWANWIY